MLTGETVSGGDIEPLVYVSACKAGSVEQGERHVMAADMSLSAHQIVLAAPNSTPTLHCRI